MSKRVSNKKGAHAGVRCKGVRWGYWRKQNYQLWQEQQKGLHKDLRKAARDEDEKVAEQIKEAITYAKDRLKALLPKTLQRRHQSR